jgi:hypothetical protein
LPSKPSNALSVGPSKYGNLKASNASLIPAQLKVVDKTVHPVASSKARASPVMEETVPRGVVVGKVEAEAVRKAVVKIVPMKTKAVRKEAEETDPFLVVVVRPKLVVVLREAVDNVAG